LFMFQDILRNQTGSTFSLSMYDELFDSALDAKGVNKILDILRERVENYQECVYIVSHNKETLKADIDHVVLLQKNDGKTELIS
jgi:ABC-type Mn2+/Zn2+ transport system ATPase subunit